MSEHQLSKLTTGMVKAPLIPGTNTISTLHDKNRALLTAESTMQKYYNEDVLAVYQMEPENFKPVSAIERDPGIAAFDLDRDNLTAEFYQKLQDLKSEHKKTLRMLEQLYVEADTRCHHVKNGSTDSRDSIVMEQSNVFLTENGSNLRNGQLETEGGESNSDPSNESLDREDTEERPSVRFQEPVANGGFDFSKRYRFDKVEGMWDDFKLTDYLPPPSNISEDKSKEKVKRPRSVPVKKKEWSPVITIPKPFSMTIREEKKQEKSHTRSSEEVARAAREKMEREELELQHRVRPKDPPAHTFVPLFEEIMERQEQRSRMNKENASRALQVLVKEFSFMERERKKEQEKKRNEKVQKRKEKRNLKSMAQFTANPIPSCIHDPTISDRMKEDLLYRKIKVKMRSEDLMRSSALPPRMHSHQLMYAERRKARAADIRRANKLSFRPQTHEMPDFEALHRRQQMEQSARKMELESTITEPFNLRTTTLRKKKLALEAAKNKVNEEDEEFQKSMKRLKGRRNGPLISESVPTKLTESARLRIEETRKALAKAERELEEMKQQEKERKERRKRMAREVTARAMMTEAGNPVPDEYRKEKLRQYQKQQKLRNEEYKRELREINDRLKQRPLLFEQQAQNSARVHAEKRYQEILRNSGLSDDFVEDKSSRIKEDKSVSFQDDYSDDEFDTSIIQSGPGAAKVSDSDSEESGEDLSAGKTSETSVKKHLDFDV